jgi:hypothetical protein
MKFLITAMGLLGLLLAPSLSRADISITPGNNRQPNEVNIHLNGGDVGTTVSGTADTTLGTYTVNFTSTQTLLVPGSGNGQSHIEAVVSKTDHTQIGLTNASISLASGSPTSTFEDFILDLHNGSDDTRATGVNFTTNGTTSGTVTTFFTVAAGENYFTFLASAGDQINSISFQTTGGSLLGFDDLQQPRISFTGAVAVPEPSTLGIAGLGALGFLGYGLARRRAR